MSLLFLAHRVPFPPDRGDKIRSFHILQYLAKRTAVHLVAFADDDADLDPPAVFTDLLTSCTILPRGKSQKQAAVEALATGKPVSLAAFASPAMQAAVDRVLPAVSAVYCFSGQMAQYLPVDGPLVVMNFVDVDSAKFAGFADDARGPMRWMMQREARLLVAFEQKVAGRVSASLFVSDAEAALFWDSGAMGRILAVENGIDSANFDPAIKVSPESSPLPEREGQGVGRFPQARLPLAKAGQPTPNPSLPGRGGEALNVFTGQMDYRPNIDAVTWFRTSGSAISPALRSSAGRRHPPCGLWRVSTSRLPARSMTFEAG